MLLDTGRLRHVVLGGYTAETEGTGTGAVSLLAGPEADLSLTEVSTLPLTSPTYVITHPTLPWLLAVGESEPTTLSTLRLRDDGALELVDQVETGGDFGCHLAISPDGRFVVVAHYGSGSVASFALAPDGGLRGPLGLVAFSGTGPDEERQEAPHAHQVVFDGQELLAVDLGTDRIHRLRLEPDGALTETDPPIVLPPGSGPRHLVVVGRTDTDDDSAHRVPADGDLLVVACELSVELWLARRTADGWSHRQTVPTTNRTESDDPVLPSALRVEGPNVYVATRGVDTVTVFGLDRTAARLTRQTEFGCGGVHPRDLVLSSDRLWVANQHSDRVSVFDRQTLTGEPVYTLDTPRPACVVLLGARPGTGTGAR